MRPSMLPSRLSGERSLGGQRWCRGLLSRVHSNFFFALSFDESRTEDDNVERGGELSFAGFALLI